MKVPIYKALRTECGGVRLGVREHFAIEDGYACSTPDACAVFFRQAFGLEDYADEHVCILCMDAKAHVIGAFEASHGASCFSLFPVREIMRNVLLTGAVCIVAAHNHPSGDPFPSGEDIAATDGLRKACDVCGVRFFDHLILACGSRAFSFEENGMLGEIKVSEWDKH